MRKLLLASAALVVLTGTAKADFVAVTGNAVEMADFALNLNSSKNLTSSSGIDDGDTIGIASTFATGVPGVFTPSGELFDTASGNATITPTKGDLLFNTLTFTPGAGFQFTSFTTRGQLQSVAGNVTLIVDDNFGQEFTFSEPKSSDWTPIGVEAIAGSGEFITSITITTDDPFGFKEIKQETFGFQVAPAVPEASTWVMALLGFAGVGLAALRKRRNVVPFRIA